MLLPLPLPPAISIRPPLPLLLANARLANLARTWPNMFCFKGLVCFFCNSIRRKDNKSPTVITVSGGSFHAQHLIKRCRTCQAHFHYSYFTRYKVNYDDNKLAKFFYNDCLEKEYFFTSAYFNFLLQFCIYSLWNTTCQKNFNSFCNFECIKTIVFTFYCSSVFIHFEIQLVKRTLTLFAVLNA